MSQSLQLKAGEVALSTLRAVYDQPTSVSLLQSDRERVAAAAAMVDVLAAGETPVYGINTGFGLLAQTRIPVDQIDQLQRNLLLSHACGVGEALPDAIVRLILALKINSLGAWPFRSQSGGARRSASFARIRDLPGNPRAGLGGRLRRFGAPGAS
jgi:histidine ammonia-lyase